MQRRKTLSNALYNSKIIDKKNEIEDMLKKLNIDTNIRGEKLALQDFANIEEYISKK